MALQFTNTKEKPITMIYDIAPKRIGTITIDAFLEEKHSSKNTVSDLPVEEGYNISDNVFEEPDEIEISGFISSAWNDSQFQSIDVPKQNAVALHNSLRDKVIQFNQALKKLVKDKKPITITTGLYVYEDMIITSYDVPRDVETGADLHFTMSLRKIRVVSSEMDVMVNAPDNAQLGNELEGGKVNKEKIMADMSIPLQYYLKDLASGKNLEPEVIAYWEEEGKNFANLKGVQWQEIKNWGMKMQVQ